MANATTIKKYEALGGRDMLIKVNKSFYDKMYAHPWIGQFFQHVPQDYIESQQTNFMQAILGGENIYGGKTPVFAHTRIKVTEEMFDIREALLLEALAETGACDALKDAWLKTDLRFKDAILEKSKELEESSPFGPLMDFPKP